MSAFFGEFRQDGERTDPSHLEAMAAAVPWYARDGSGSHCEGSIGLGALQVCLTPESRREAPLSHDLLSRCLLAGNFRIDNRDELNAELCVLPDGDGIVTDAALILVAYARWGDECGRHLIGDFAFAIWDRDRGHLLLVRDQIGIAPLYFFKANRGLIFASDLRALAAHPEGPRDLDPVALAHHLRDLEYLLPTTTFLAGVRKLAPGHTLSISAGAVCVRAYWSPSDVATVRLPDRDAYAKRLRLLFEEAVACRLRTCQPVGTHLSGGLDSTSIAFEAQRQLAARGERLAGAYTWLPDLRPGDDPDAPEYAVLRRAEIALGLNAARVNLDVASLQRDLRRNIALEGFADLWYETLVRAKAKEMGAGVLLSGWGGDQAVSSGAGGYAAELFWSGRWAKLSRELKCQLSAQQQNGCDISVRAIRRTLGFLHGAILLPAWPKSLFCHWQNRRVRSLPGFDPSAPELSRLNGNLPCRLVWQPLIGKRATMTRALTAGFVQARIEAWAAQGAQDGIRYMYPLLDLRLIEFCLGAPPEVFAGYEQSRGFFRNAMMGLLPDDIRKVSVKFEPIRVERMREVLRATVLGSPAALGKNDPSFAAYRKMQVAAMQSELESSR